MKNVSRIFLALGLQLSTFFAIAQEPPLVTDRPGQSNSPSLIPTGAVQVESGLVVEKDRSQSTVNYTYNNTLLKFGVNDNFEARVALSYVGQQSILKTEPPQNGFSPISIGAKIRLFQEKSLWTSAALLTHVNVKSNSGALSPNYTSTDVTLAFMHALKRFSLTYNGGLKWDGYTPAPTWLYTFSLGYETSEKTAVFFETYGFLPEQRHMDYRTDAGFTWKIAPMIQYDISGGIGLTGKQAPFFFSTGLSARFIK